jgi:hypothetical protein
LEEDTANAKTILELETMLAIEIRRCLAVCGQGGSTEHAALMSVATVMSGLIQRLLEGNQLWEPDCWVDCINPSSPLEVVPLGQVTLDGLLIFGRGGKGTQQWWEPFYGSLRISETSDEILSYDLKFGDAAWGLGKVRYNEHPKGWNWSRPAKWIFVFSKP